MTRTLILLPLFIGTIAQSATISATVPQATYAVGAPVAVTISISNVTDLYAFQFDLSFNPRALTAQSVIEGNYFSSHGISFSPGRIDNSVGIISFIADSLSGPGPGFTGDTLLATAQFIALAPSSTSVSPLNVVLLNSSLSDIDSNTSAALVTVSGVTTPEPGFLGFLSGFICVVLAAICSRVHIRTSKDKSWAPRIVQHKGRR